ncbi:MAG: BON domain-containing protein [Bdellovibrionota bacterium]
MLENNFEKSYTDKELEETLGELLRNSKQNYARVRVSVDQRNVFFYGMVESERAREHLEELANMVMETGVVMNEVRLEH